MSRSRSGGAPRRALSGVAAFAVLGAMMAPLTAQADEGPLAPGSPSPESKIQTNEATTAAVVPGSYMVELAGPSTAEGGSLAAIKTQRGRFMADAKAAGVALEVRSEHASLWNGVTVEASSDDLVALAASDAVTAIYPVMKIDAPERPEATTIDPELFTAISMTGADIVHSELGFTGKGVRVGIIDTGIDIDHPDLGGNGTPGSTPFPSSRVKWGYDFVGDDFNADPGSGESFEPHPTPDANPDDCQGHGTHVAGIVGANGDVTGVAPDVEFGAYRVFGCDGSTESDIMLHAMERSLSDGMDVVNMSIGSAFSSWAEYPTAKAATALANEGVVVTASIGNEGASGLQAAGAPGVGKNVIGVGSIENTMYMAKAFADEMGNQVTYAVGSDNPAPPESGSWDLVALSTNPTACTATGGITDDVKGKYVLISRGSCTFYEKAFNAQQAGALGVVLYNNVPGAINPSTAGDPPITIPVIMISKADGERLVADAKANGTTTVTWQPGEVQVPNPVGGLASSFTSWGPMANLLIKPDLSAPGGMIYSTYPLEKEPYATLSGTSMSAPHVAGAAALMLEAEPDLSVEQVRIRLQNSSVPTDLSVAPGNGYTEPVHHVGAGLIQIDDAILADVYIDPGMIQLGQQLSGATTTQKVVLTNLTGTDHTYTISHTAAVSTQGTPNDWDYYLDEAEVSHPAQVTVPAGDDVTVEVSITSPPAVAMFGGYLTFTDVTDEENDYVLPYGGYSGDFQDIEVLADQVDADGNVVRELPSLGKVATCEIVYRHDCVDPNGTFAYAGAGTTYTMVGADVPVVLIHFEVQPRSMVWNVYQANADGSQGQLVGTVKSEDYLDRASTRNGVSAYTWDGRVDNGTGKMVEVPEGAYMIEVVVTKSRAWNDERPAETESWTSPSFNVDWTVPGRNPVVTRYQGQDRYSSASEVALENFPDGADTVYIASGQAFPDALTGSAKAGSEEAPVLLTKATSLPPATRMALQSLSPSRIVVLGGSTAVSGEVMSRLGDYAPRVDRISGKERYATAAAVAATYPTSTDTVFVASGADYPDALAAAAKAGMEDAPVLLVRPGSIPGATAAQLARFTPSHIVLLGGTKAVSTAVEKELQAYSPRVDRVAGKDRYGTAALLAKTFDDPHQVWLTSGTNFPDALSAAPVAAMNNSPVVLTRQAALPGVTLKAIVDLAPDEIHIVGGLKAVSRAIELQLEALVLP